MLSVPGSKRPHLVTIRIAKAEKLVLSKKDNKKKLNSKFRVVVLGGKKKESTPLVEDLNGNPEWGFTCSIKLHSNTADPICLLVEDSEGHQKGQVTISLVKIGPKPYTYSPDQSPATSSNLICSELEASKKCAVAAGFLIYWIWVDEYFSEDDNASRGSFNKSMTSLFSSKSGLKSSNTRLSIPTGSVSNISSGTSLNKPESHKKTLSFLHHKSNKDKSKKPTANFRMSPDNSDVESAYPFDGNKGRSTSTNRTLSSGSSDLQIGGYGNPFSSVPERPAHGPPITEVPDRVDIASLGSTGSYSRSGSFTKHGDVPEYNPFASIALPSLTPNTNTTLKSPTTIKSESQALPTTLLGKSNLLNNPSPTTDRNPFYNQTESQKPQFDEQFQLGHKAVNDSDYSLFSDHSMDQQPSSATNFRYYEPVHDSTTPITLSPVDRNMLLSNTTTTVNDTKRTIPASDDQYTTKIETASFQPDYKTKNFVDFSVKQPLSTITKVPDYQPVLQSMTPITLPPHETGVMISKSPPSIKEASKTMPNRYNQGSPSFGREQYNPRMETASPQHNEPGFLSGHKTKNVSDYASFSERNVTHGSMGVKGFNDEADILRKENSELKALSNKSTNRINELQSELDYVKECLFKLRTRLLEEGATKFLERL